jgi:hypothetical protein
MFWQPRDHSAVSQVTGFRDAGADGTLVDFALTWVPHNATDRYNSGSTDYNPNAAAAAQYFYQMLTTPDDAADGWVFWRQHAGYAGEQDKYGTQTVLPPSMWYQVCAMPRCWTCCQNCSSAKQSAVIVMAWDASSQT